MSIIPVIAARMMARVLIRAGFTAVRQVGSHLRFVHPLTKRAVTVPMHAGDLSRKIVSSVLKQAGLNIAEFLKLLKK